MQQIFVTIKQSSAALLLLTVTVLLVSIATFAQAEPFASNNDSNSSNSRRSSSKSAPSNGEATELSLNAQASAEIPEDIVHILLFYEEQAGDPSALTLALQQKAEQALRIAKAQNKVVSVRSGTFTIYPSTDHDGHIHGWRGRTEVLLESSDFSTATRLAGQLSSFLSIDNVRFSLSPQAKQKAQTRLTTDAIAAFREKAKLAARAFGYSSYIIRKVEIHDSGVISPSPIMMAARTATSAAGTDLPIEAGKTTVTISVSGSVQMVP